jgi:hypothetical protein
VEIRENDSQYRYINPLLLVDSPRQDPQFNQIKSQLNDYIEVATEKHQADNISVYLRDLDSGRWAGINENELYDPSSMLKVAVMIGYYNEASNDPSVLAKELPYLAVTDPGQNYKPDQPLATGYYPVDRLIKEMIVESDNQALQSLYKNNDQVFVDVLRELKIPLSPSLTTVDFMSPKTYSALLRTLYSSTYLSRNVSEKALDLLTKTSFNKGIVAGLPANILVAHKFGEHTLARSDHSVVSRQLHDCGVVYYTPDPYLLCVMTRGQDFSQLEKIITDISRLVYKREQIQYPSLIKN